MTDDEKRPNPCNCIDHGIIDDEQHEFTYCPNCGRRL